MADHLGLERVLWIPAGRPPHKAAAAVSPAGVRLQMVREAVGADPRFDVSTVEVDRPGPSWMVDTVKELAETFPGADLFLIIGADEFRDFDSWRDPLEIVRHAHLAVMDRAGDSARDMAPDTPAGDQAVFVPVCRVDVSSTLIRDAVRRGEPVDDLVPPGVAAIIQREGLYSAP